MSSELEFYVPGMPMDLSQALMILRCLLQAPCTSFISKERDGVFPPTILQSSELPSDWTNMHTPKLITMTQRIQRVDWFQLIRTDLSLHPPAAIHPPKPHNWVSLGPVRKEEGLRGEWGDSPREVALIPLFMTSHISQSGLSWQNITDCGA